MQDGHKLIKFDRDLKVDKNFNQQPSMQAFQRFQGFTVFCFNNGEKDLIGTFDKKTLYAFEMNGHEYGKWMLHFEGLDELDDPKDPSIKVKIFCIQV